MKKLSPDAIDDFHLFQQISVRGVIYLLPAVVFFEGKSIRDWYYFYFDSSNLNLASESIIAFLSFNSFLFLNGLAFSIYNLVSYLLLSNTDLATQAVLNAFRRVVIIIFTSLYFRIKISSFNVLGVIIAISAVGVFGYFKARESKSKIALPK